MIDKDAQILFDQEVELESRYIQSTYDDQEINQSKYYENQADDLKNEYIYF